MNFSTSRQLETKPRLSLLIISDVSAPDTFPTGMTGERVMVTPKAGSRILSLPGERQLRSTAAPARRLNLAISLASGEWIVPITGDVEVGANCLSQLEHELTMNDDTGVLVLQDDKGGVIFAIRRRAFAYGAPDERLGDAQAALFDWVRRIFPAPKYRTLGCDKIRYLQIFGLRCMSSPAKIAFGLSNFKQSMSGPSASAPLATDYVPKQFWDSGTADYVKWEVFQPDEPEIEDVLRLTAPRRVLELGCGAGRNIRYFSRCEQYAGIDIARNLLRRAGDRVEANALGLVRGDIVRLPFAAAAFDLVFSDSTIQHVVPERIDECMADILRVSARYVCLIEFVDELPEHPGWFQNIHMFKHDYVELMKGRARLLKNGAPGLQIQPAVKEYFLFEKI